MREVRTEIEIQVKPSLVVDCFFEQELLNGWWGVQRSHTNREIGSPYILLWEVSSEGIKYISTGVIKSYSDTSFAINNMMYLNPDKQILGPMELEVSCKGSGESSHVEILQSGYQTGGDWDWYYQAVVEAWPMAAKTLKDFAESL